MAEARPHLRVVDTQTGELAPECPQCQAFAAQLAGAETDIRSWRTRFQNLKREHQGASESHDLFPEAKRLFDFWREACKHPRSKFTPERFEQCLPHLRDEGAEMCRRAIEGAAYEPFTTVRRNGTLKRHDGWALIFQSREKLEDFANRAPYHLPSADAVKTLASAVMFIYPGMLANEAVEEARRRLT